MRNLLLENRQIILEMQHIVTRLLTQDQVPSQDDLAQLMQAIETHRIQISRVVEILDQGIVSEVSLHAIRKYIHDARHDMSVPIGYVEMMQHGLIAPDQIRARLESIATRLEQALTRIKDFEAEMKESPWKG